MSREGDNVSTSEPEPGNHGPSVVAQAAAGTTVLITVTGPDRPGVTSVLLAALARNGVSLLDVEQVVIRGRLTLGVLVSCPGEPEGLQDELEDAMVIVGMQVEVEIDAEPSAGARLSTHAIVVLGSPVTARAFSVIARKLAEQDVNIDAIRGVADYPVTGLELTVTAPATETAETIAARISVRIGLAFLLVVVAMPSSMWGRGSHAGEHRLPHWLGGSPGYVAAAVRRSAVTRDDG